MSLFIKRDEDAPVIAFPSTDERFSKRMIAVNCSSDVSISLTV